MSRFMTEQLESRRLMAAIDLVGGVLRIESTRPGERVNVVLMQSSAMVVTTELDGSQRVLRIDGRVVDASYTDLKAIVVDADFSEVSVSREDAPANAPTVATAPVDVEAAEQLGFNPTLGIATLEQQAAHAIRARELDAINARLHAADA